VIDGNRRTASLTLLIEVGVRPPKPHSPRSVGAAFRTGTKRELLTTRKHTVSGRPSPASRASPCKGSKRFGNPKCYRRQTISLRLEPSTPHWQSECRTPTRHDSLAGRNIERNSQAAGRPAERLTGRVKASLRSETRPREPAYLRMADSATREKAPKTGALSVSRRWEDRRARRLGAPAVARAPHRRSRRGHRACEPRAACARRTQDCASPR